MHSGGKPKFLPLILAFTTIWNWEIQFAYLLSGIFVCHDHWQSVDHTHLTQPSSHWKMFLVAFSTSVVQVLLTLDNLCYFFSWGLSLNLVLVDYDSTKGRSFFHQINASLMYFITFQSCYKSPEWALKVSFSFVFLYNAH